MHFADSAPRLVRATYTVLLGWLIVGVFACLLEPNGVLHPLFGPVAQTAVILTAAALMALRAYSSPNDRRRWAVLAAGITAWGLGNAYWALALVGAQHIPVPSPADIGYLCFTAVAIPTLFKLSRTRRRSHLGHRLDAVAAGLSVASVCTAIVLPRLGGVGDGRTIEIVIALSYPMTDLLLIGTIVAASARAGWEVGARWAMLAAGACMFGVADSVYAVDNLHDVYAAGGWYDMGWSGGMLLLSAAAWQSSGRSTGDHAGRHLIMSALFAAIALTVVGLAVIGDVPDTAAAFALIALLAQLARSTVTLRENLRILRMSRREALTDALTGLGNRRRLLRDLQAHLEDQDGPIVMALFDLDGFKNYNDAFGHPSGDALLVRLGDRLRAHLGGTGSAYRLGGDEFCMLLRAEPRGAKRLARLAAAQLTERGEGFVVGCTAGHVVIPHEADEAAEALKVADRRLYAAKNSGRASTSRQSADVLVRALHEQRPGLTDVATSVAVVASAIGEQLGIAGEELDLLRTAAQLSDIGKIAIPDDVLAKAGALEAEEWRFLAEHPVVGERILAAAPALAPVARIVRSTHERWDGLGYPDSLSGTAIPLAARVVAVSDAFDAMTRERPHQAHSSIADAITELSSAAGSQFDPAVVAALRAALGEPLRPGRPQAQLSGSPR